MTLGVYFHIPYCIKRCRYCDFVSNEVNQCRISLSEYVLLLKQEIAMRADLISPANLSSLYFGGGTPSLLDSSQILLLIQELRKHGLNLDETSEVTIEINPATLTKAKLKEYLSVGINRFSVGAQTFSDDLLKLIGRAHSSLETKTSLQMLSGLNFSGDILFSLPTQTLHDVKEDLALLSDFGPAHISAYLLTLPDNHLLNLRRPEEDVQAEMYESVEQILSSRGFAQYEISNYSLPGKESKHNMLYWTDKSYLGFGVSAHSYIKDSKWGRRFWNASDISTYNKQIETAEKYPQDQFEILSKEQSLTDFCHTSLRLNAGMVFKDVEDKYSMSALLAVKSRLAPFMPHLVETTSIGLKLTAKGRLLSNQVFEELALFDLSGFY